MALQKDYDSQFGVGNYWSVVRTVFSKTYGNEVYLGLHQSKEAKVAGKQLLHCITLNNFDCGCEVDGGVLGEVMLSKIYAHIKELAAQEGASEEIAFFADAIDV